MNAVAQFLVELSWAMTMGLLVTLGILAAQALGLAAAGLGALALCWVVCRRVIRGRRGSE